MLMTKQQSNQKKTSGSRKYTIPGRPCALDCIIIKTGHMSLEAECLCFQKDYKRLVFQTSQFIRRNFLMNELISKYHQLVDCGF